MNVLNTMLMTIPERTREIELVAALGWSDARIMASIVLEVLVLCALGCAFGTVLGFLASLLFARSRRSADTSASHRHLR
jgi:putative ABC transport system permease protein